MALEVTNRALIASLPSETVSKRVHYAFLLVGVLFVTQLLAASVLRLSALHPSGLLPSTMYNAAFALHGSLSFPLLNAIQIALTLLLCPVGDAPGLRGRVTSAALWLTLTQVLCASSALLWPLPNGVTRVGMLIPNLGVAILLASCAARWRRLGVATAAIFSFAAISAAVLPLARAEHSFILFALWLWAVPNASASATNSNSTSRPRNHRGASQSAYIFASCSSAFALLTLTGVAGGVLLFVQLILTASVVIACWRQLYRLSPAFGARTLFRAGLVMTTLALLLRASRGAISFDIDLGDTLFSVASYHSWALAGVLLFASVSAAGFRPLQEAPWATRVPAAVLAAASLAFVGLFAGLGARGMPSRFMRYLDEFSPSQVAASVATFTILAGFAYYVVVFTVNGTAWSPLYGLRPESDDG